MAAFELDKDQVNHHNDQRNDLSFLFVTLSAALAYVYMFPAVLPIPAVVALALTAVLSGVAHVAAADMRAQLRDSIRGACRAVGACSLSFLQMWVFHDRFCGAALRCGCTWPWAGGAALCNWHNTSPPQCPWCLASKRLSFWRFVPHPPPPPLPPGGDWPPLPPSLRLTE